MMEISKIIKALKFCISQTDHTCYEEMEECPYSNCLIDCQDRLMKEAADALEKLSATPKNEPLDAVELAKIAMALQQLKSENTELVEMMNEGENKPITLEELRKMDNQPVWTDIRCGVVRAIPQSTRRPGMPAIHFNYGWEWADDVLKRSHIYAHKPEEK